MQINQDICNTALMSREIGERLFERLSYFKIQPRVVLDLSCGSAYFLQRLEQQYPEAVVHGLDFSADMHDLPFAEASLDLVFVNQVFHRSSMWAQLFEEIHRVMRVDGCLMFSMLGLDTFQELNEFDPDWAATLLPARPDMHDVGDALLKTSFLDPVMDREVLIAHHREIAQLVHTLGAEGVRDLSESRVYALEQYLETQRNARGKLPLTYEVLYGHAWRGEVNIHAEEGETWIPISSIRRGYRYGI